MSFLQTSVSGRVMRGAFGLVVVALPFAGGCGFAQADIANGASFVLNGHRGAVNRVEFSPDGSRAASAGADGTVRVWSMKDGSALMSVKGHETSVWSLTFLDNDTVASAGEDMQIHLWNVRTGARSSRPLGWHNRAVVGMAFDPKSRRLVTAARDHTAKVWTLGGNEVETLTPGASVAAVAFSPDGGVVATACANRTVRFWNVSDGRESAALPNQSANVCGITFSPDGKFVATAAVNGLVTVWDARTSRSVRVISAHESEAWSVSFSPDSKYLATGGRDGAVKVYRLADGKQIVFRRHNGTVTSVSFSPDGKHLASAGFDSVVKVWNMDRLTAEMIPGLSIQ